MSAAPPAAAPAGVDRIPVDGLPVLLGRGPDADVRLPEGTVSKTHARLSREDGALVVEDLESRFGTFVNGLQVGRKTLAPGDRVRLGSTLVFRAEGDGLRRDAGGGGLEVRAENVAVERGGKRLCEGLSFEVAPDELVALLGPSGAGKSTLLNCLAGFLAPARGRVGVEDAADAHRDPELLHAVAAYVPQDDEGVLPSLTVRENLLAAAELRLGGSAAGETPAEAADRVLAAVDLEPRADLPAGALSGGQRKRLSVGFELLRRPRLLLLDEPTSGLDPAAEAVLTGRLRRIARRGTTVVCATHLMESLRLFDRVVVIGVKEGVGRLAFTGPAADLLGHFGVASHADLYEKLQAGDFTPFRPAAADDDPRSGTGTAAGRRRLTSHDARTAPRAAQWKTLTGRSLRAFVRDRGLVTVAVAQPVGLAVLNVVSQIGVGGNAAAVPATFFLLVIALWLGLNNSGRVLVGGRRRYVRERRAGVKPGPYLLAEAAALGVVGAAQVTLLLAVFLAAAWPLLTYDAWTRLVGEDANVVMPPLLWLILLVCHACGLAAGLVASALSRTPAAAVAVLPLLVLPQLLLSAVGNGAHEDVFDADLRRGPEPFRPLGVKLNAPEGLDGGEPFLDLLSLGVFTRPAAVLARPPEVVDDREWVLILDAAHLLVLLLGTCTLLWWAFRRGEERWLRLEGLR